MGLLLISIAAFFLCWILLFITWIRLVIVKHQLNNKCDKQYKLNVKIFNRSIVFNAKSFKVVTKTFLSFGNKENIKVLYANFYNIDLMEVNNEKLLLHYVNKLLKLHSMYIKLFVLMWLFLIILFFLWPNDLLSI